MLRLRLTHPARRDIADLLDWSAEHFGAAGRRRYEALLEAALRDIAADPGRPGSREEPQLGPDLRIYHIRLSRDRARAQLRRNFVELLGQLSLVKSGRRVPQGEALT